MKNIFKIIVMEPNDFFRHSLVSFIEEHYPTAIEIVSVSNSLSDLRRDMIKYSFDAIITDLYGRNENITLWREFYSTFSLLCAEKSCLLWTMYNTHHFSVLRNFTENLYVINKKSSLSEFHYMIKNILEGGGNSNIPKGINRSDELSPNESEVILRYLQGESLTRIAVTLKRSVKTISTHKRNAMYKLRVRNNKELLMLNRNMSQA